MVELLCGALEEDVVVLELDVPWDVAAVLLPTLAEEDNGGRLLGPERPPLVLDELPRPLLGLLLPLFPLLGPVDAPLVAATLVDPGLDEPPMAELAAALLLPAAPELPLPPPATQNPSRHAPAVGGHSAGVLHGWRQTPSRGSKPSAQVLDRGQPAPSARTPHAATTPPQCFKPCMWAGILRRPRFMPQAGRWPRSLIFRAFPAPH